MLPVEILGNVQFIGETLPNFSAESPVFSEWARHRGDVRNSKGFVSDYGKIRGGSFQKVTYCLVDQRRKKRKFELESGITKIKN
ncbi:Leucine-rich repeat family protein [Prunus dulcis]|uniref:Leucine-rich repeat family protein n=1 Tax=Prunus dulcis TaxID=3755 RepID=A0A4Y1RC77_PRUDU|nr:Leucine-rich repeat family protein [Prunus dulcis]